MARRTLSLVFFSIALVAFTFGPAGPAQAATIVVTTNLDQLDGAAPCSLREALISANTDTATGGCPAGSGADVIDLKAEIYRLTRQGAEDASLTGDLDITEDVTIRGRSPSKTTIQAAYPEQSDRVFDVLISTEVARIMNVTIRDGVSGGGGGIFVRGAGPSLFLSDAVLRNNSATLGGGILTTGSAAFLSDVTFVDNDALSNGDGGGLYTQTFETTLSNVTFAGNTAQDDGGAVLAQAGSNVVMNNVTIDGNEADSDSINGGDGGGVAVLANSTLTTSNSIIAENQDQSPLLADKAPDCDGPVTSAGHNLIGITDGCTFASAVGDQTGTFGSPLDPGNGPLGNHGGPTPTIPLLPGSPAIDHGAPSGGAGGTPCESLDQRGVPRSLDLPCDQGAYELVTCFGQPITLVGTEGRDTIVGGPGRDFINALGGNDSVFGGGGDDFICGATGNDTLRGEGGNDSLDGEAHTDICIGGEGRDRFANCETVQDP